jgi:hypothetical protein
MHEVCLWVWVCSIKWFNQCPSLPFGTVIVVEGCSGCLRIQSNVVVVIKAIPSKE